MRLTKARLDGAVFGSVLWKDSAGILKLAVSSWNVTSTSIFAGLD